MSDDLVKRLKLWEEVFPEDLDKVEGHLYHEAADRIEQLERELSISRMAQVVMDNSVAEVERLQAQNMRMSGMVHDLKKEVAISDALLISEAEASLGRLERAENAEADNARLRAAIETISYYNTVGYTDMALDAASAALIEKPVVTK